MPARPETVPLFATDPDAPRIEVAELTRQGGFAPDQRIPAEWLNWLFNQIGKWINFLKGPSLANWTRVDLVDTGVYAGVGLANLCADATTIEPAAGPRRRLVFTEPTALWTSKRGDSWLKQGKNNITGNLGYLTFSAAGTRWVVTSQDSKVWWSWPDDGTHTTAIGDVAGAHAWNSSTLPGGVGAITGIASGTDGVVVITSTQILWSVDGTAFAYESVSSAPTGDFCAVVYVPASTSTPAGWVALTGDGEIYRAPVTGTATWVKNGTTTLPASLDWRLECDDGGRVLAYRVDAGTALAWYVSADGGQTWSAQSAPSTVTTIKQVRWLDGMWFACAATPGLAASATLDAPGWAALRLPIQDGWTGFNPVMICLSEGRYIAPVSATSAWAYSSLRAEDTSPGPWTPSNVPHDLFDAAYFRGRPIDPSAPSVGDTWEWDGAMWTLVPGGGGGGGGTAFTITRTNTTGATLAQGTPVYNTGGNINKSRANASATAAVLGLVAADTAAGDPAGLITDGAATIDAAVQTGTWVDGDEIYLDDLAAGKLTNAPPTPATGGPFALPVGRCVGTPAGGAATLVVRIGQRSA
jgi:hypothetical protein